MVNEEALEKFMNEEYNPFRERARKHVFMSIAVFCQHNRPINGYYFEFGCHAARTMRLAYDAFGALYDWTYVAFDSFCGLPEPEGDDRMDIFRKGNLATSEEEFTRRVLEHGMPREKLVTVAGFFEESLTPGLRERLLPTKAAVVFIDCDFYASTVPVLDFVKDFLQRGTVIVFDDWFCFHGDPGKGERRAFAEFRARNENLVFEEYIQTSEAKAFIYLGERAEAGGAGEQS